MEMQSKKSLKHKVLFALCSVLLIIMSVSCGKKEIYYHFHELKDEAWSQSDTLVFEIDSAMFELHRPYNLSIELTNSINYPYRNIWIFTQINTGSDSIYTNETKEFSLADEFGKWEGSGFGSLYQSSLPFGQVIFKEKRIHRVKIEHGMRDEPLKGIEKVGIRISETQ